MAGRCGNRPEITEPRIHPQIRALGIHRQTKNRWNQKKSYIFIFDEDQSILLYIYVMIKSR